MRESRKNEKKIDGADENNDKKFDLTQFLINLN